MWVASPITENYRPCLCTVVSVLQKPKSASFDETAPDPETMGIFNFFVAGALLSISYNFGCPGSPFVSSLVNGALHYMLNGRLRFLAICASLAISRGSGCHKPVVLALATNCALRYMPRGTLRHLAICASLAFSYYSGDPLIILFGSAAGWVLSYMIEGEGGEVLGYMAVYHTTNTTHQIG